MTNPNIRAALEAAIHAAIWRQPLCFTDSLAPLSKCATTRTWQPCRCRLQAISAVAAFLSAPPPSADTIRLHLGEVSPQGMRDIYAYHRWLAAVVTKAASHD